MVRKEGTEIAGFDSDSNIAVTHRNGVNNGNSKRNDKEESELLFQLNDAPKWYAAIFLGIQQCFLALGGLLVTPFILAPALCMGDNDVGYLARAMVLNTIFFISGIATFLQVTFGTRLPILQGGSFCYLPPALAILALPRNKCPDEHANVTLPDGTLLYNETDGTLVDGNELWMGRMREIQGAIAIASVVEIVLSLTGAIGLLTRFIGPLTVGPAIALLGLSLFDTVSHSASGHWAVAFFTVITLVLLSQYLRNVLLPVPAYSRRKGLYMAKSNIIRLYPVLITIVLSWLLCLILTMTGSLPEDASQKGYSARTDTRINVLIESPWFRLPYPGQWGLPVTSVAGVVGMIAGVLSSIIESIGDYYACARLSGAPVIPRHAINRGLFMEGMATVVAGLFGTGSGITSYSENIGAIAITKVASRWVLQMAGALLIVVGMLGKFGAVLVMIPDPAIGGLFCVMFGLISAVGISNLQYVNLNSSRNLFIIGFSLFMGLMVPVWVKANESSIDTGSEEVDQILIVLLETSIFVGGVLAAFFDNTLPGTPEERGIASWQKISSEDTDISTVKGDGTNRLGSMSAYDLPFSTNWRFSKYIPILPEYDR